MIGRVLGSYRITRQIGEGGMGAVYLAEHPIIGKQAAVKVLRPEVWRNNAEILERFFNEARATARLDHPAFVDIFDCGVADGSAFIVMEYVRGESLGARLARLRTFSVADAVAIGRKIAAAVGMAHLHGIVHRDLKPDNIIISSGEGEAGEGLKILDFGIAKLSPALWEHRPTRTGALLGTPQYMSPEQCRGAATVDERADVYSLGCILHALLVGEPPFASMSDADILAAQLYRVVAPLRTRLPSLPAELDRLVQSMLAKVPEQRPRSMQEVDQALAALAPVVAAAPAVVAGAQAPYPAAEPTAPTVSMRVAGSGAPAVSPGEGVAVAGARRNTTFTRSTGEMGAAPSPATRPNARPALWVIVASAAVVVLAAGLLPRLLASRPEVTIRAEPAPPPPRPAPPVEPAPRPAAAVPVPAPVAAPAPAPAAGPREIKVQLDSRPPGATVTDVDSKDVLGTTPLTRSLPRGTRVAAFLLQKKGYQAKTITLPLDEDIVRTVPLLPRKAPPGPRPAAVDPDEWRKL